MIQEMSQVVILESVRADVSVTNPRGLRKNLMRATAMSFIATLYRGAYASL